MVQLRDEVRSSLNEQKLEDLSAQQRAQEVEQKLASGTDFAVLAAQYSYDSSTSGKGGDLGPASLSRVQSEDAMYAKAVLALSVRQPTEPSVRDQQGYDIVQLLAATPSALHLRHILVDAPRPYTVKERPTWFTQAVFSVLAQDCAVGQIHVYAVDVGPDPCATPTPSPTTVSAPTSASPSQ